MKYYLPTLKKKVAHEVANQLGYRAEEVDVEIANEKSGADLAVPVFKFASKNIEAKDLAKQLAAEISFLDIDKVEAVGGYVNIWLRTDALARGLFGDIKKNQLNQRKYGDNTDYYEKEIVIEYTDPNAFKEFHIGHAYSNTVGESIARLYEAGMAKVHRVSYHGDVGLHVAKALWGMNQLLDVEGFKLDDIPEIERASFLGKAYVAGSAQYEKDEASQKEIKKINQELYKKENKTLLERYEKGKIWSFDYFESIYKRLGVGFEKKYLESESAKRGTEVVKQGIKQSVFRESEGAIIFEGEDFGLHTRVFVNQQGIPTYEAKDLGLALMKHADYNYDRSIIITGNEQDQYFQVVLKALELMEPEQAAVTMHISHGMVNLKGKKMSSRKGDVITANWLLDEVEKEIRQRSPDSPATIENTLGAVKYAFLKHSIGADIYFDIGESISLEGNSGPYIQYAAVRLSSIFEKTSTEPNPDNGYDFATEKKLLMHLLQYPEVVEEATETISPHDIANYAYGLARLSNQYYEQVSIQDSAPKEQAARLALLGVMYETLDHSLHLLGVNVPEKM